MTRWRYMDTEGECSCLASGILQIAQLMCDEDSEIHMAEYYIHAARHAIYAGEADVGDEE